MLHAFVLHAEMLPRQRRAGLQPKYPPLSRDERVAMLTEQLRARGDEILALRTSVGQKEEELRGVQEGPLVAILVDSR